MKFQPTEHQLRIYDALCVLLGFVCIYANQWGWAALLVAAAFGFRFWWGRSKQ